MMHKHVHIVYKQLNIHSRRSLPTQRSITWLWTQLCARMRTCNWWGVSSGQMHCVGRWLFVYLSLCRQTRTGQWAWCTTKSLTLPIIVRRNLPIPLVPVTTKVAFSFWATSTIAWPGLSAFSTLNSASIC